MKLKELIKRLNLEILSGEKKLLEREVQGGYIGDLLSDVLANSKENDVWITIQVHENIVAVSAMKNHSAVIISSNKEVDKETIEKAKEEKIVLLRSDKKSFELGGEIYSLLKNG